MKKKLLSVLMCMAMVASLAACGGSSDKPAASTPAENTEAPAEKTDAPAEEPAAEPAVEPITLVYAEVNPIDSIVGQTATAFKEKVEELSGGQIIIDIQAGGVLGAEGDVLDTMMAGGGTIDLTRISAFALTNYGGQKSKLLSLPFTFESREHFWNFATSDLAPEFLLEPHENGSGVRGLFFGEEGFRHFFSAKEITGIESFQGVQLRIGDDPIMQALVKGIGATPVSVSFTELYSALQTGVAEAAEQPIANYKSNAFQEVAPYMILDGHTLGAVQVIITDEAWDSLTEEQQGWLTEAGQYASEFNRNLSESAEAEVKEQLVADGVTFVEVTDLQPWKDACADVVTENIKGYEELYQQICDMK